MPSYNFNFEEVEVLNTGKVNKSGYLYVGRKYEGKEVTWIKLKDKV